MLRARFNGPFQRLGHLRLNATDPFSICGVYESGTTNWVSSTMAWTRGVSVYRETTVTTRLCRNCLSIRKQALRTPC